MMKRLFAAFIAVLALASCGKEEGGLEGGTDIQPAEPIGAYIFDGEEFPVWSMDYVADETGVMIRISPLSEDKKQTTYAVVGVNATLVGKELDIENAWNNDEYYFIYEDPVMYYSVYRKLQSGTMMIDRTGDVFDINVSVVLPDGKDFSFEYHGQID